MKLDPAPIYRMRGALQQTKERLYRIEDELDALIAAIEAHEEHSLPLTDYVEEWEGYGSCD